jgi:hypothetical protein
MRSFVDMLAASRIQNDYVIAATFEGALTI